MCQVLNVNTHVNSCRLFTGGCIFTVILPDIDECAIRRDTCDTNAICNNTIGSYNCTCKNGFMGNGFNCSKYVTISARPACLCGSSLLTVEVFLHSSLSTGSCTDAVRACLQSQIISIKSVYTVCPFSSSFHLDLVSTPISTGTIAAIATLAFLFVILVSSSIIIVAICVKRRRNRHKNRYNM